jgi:hypothetical protein
LTAEEHERAYQAALKLKAEADRLEELVDELEAFEGRCAGS